MKKKIFSFALFLILGSGFGLRHHLDKLMYDGLSAAGSAAIGTPFRLEGIDLALFLGKIGVRGLEVGNPEGFTTPHCFKVANLGVDADLKSFLGDVATLEELRITGPEVTFEIGTNGTNFGRLLSNLRERRGGGGGGASDAPPSSAAPPSSTAAPRRDSPPSASPAEPGMKFLVQKLVLEDVRVRVAQSALLSTEMTFVLPPIELANLGNANASGPAQPLEFSQLLEQILGVISLAVSEAGGIPTDLSGLLSGELKNVSLGRGRETVDKLKDSLKQGGVKDVKKELKSIEKDLEKTLDGLLGGGDDKDKDEKKKKKDKDKKKDDDKQKD
jgi:hypothetical protein